MNMDASRRESDRVEAQKARDLLGKHRAPVFETDPAKRDGIGREATLKKLREQAAKEAA